METAIATGRILVIGAVTLCLMGAVPIVYAESTSAGTGNGGHPGMTKDQNYHSQLVKLRADITAGDQEKVNRDVDGRARDAVGCTGVSIGDSRVSGIRIWGIGEHLLTLGKLQTQWAKLFE